MGWEVRARCAQDVMRMSHLPWFGVLEAGGRQRPGTTEGGLPRLSCDRRRPSRIGAAFPMTMGTCRLERVRHTSAHVARAFSDGRRTQY